MQEANPLLRSCMEYGSVEVTLVGAKSAAGVFVVSLSKMASLSLSQWGLVLAALRYGVGLVVP